MPLPIDLNQLPFTLWRAINFGDTEKNRSIAMPQESLGSVRYYIHQCEARQ